MKILVLSCKTGGGHNKAGEMLKQELLKSGHICVMRDALEFKSKKRAKSASKLYDNLIGYIPHVFGFIYQLGEIWSASGILSPVYMANRDFTENLYKYIVKQKFDAVVATHLFAMEGLWHARKKYGLKVPTYGLQTDYEAVPFFHEPKLDGYFVPCQKVKNQMIKKYKVLDFSRNNNFLN